MQANDPEDGGIATLLDASHRETSIKKKKKQKKTKKKKKKNNNKKKNFAEGGSSGRGSSESDASV